MKITLHKISNYYVIFISSNLLWIVDQWHPEHDKRRKEENGLLTMEPDIKIRLHSWLPPPQTIFFTKGIDSMCSHNKLNAVERTQYI